MADNKEIIAELIARYANGRALNKKESAQLEAWCAASEENRLVPELLREQPWLDVDRQDPSSVPSDELWDELDKQTAKSNATLETEPFYRPWAKWLGVIFIIAIAAALVLKMYNKTGSKEPFVRETDVVSGTNNPDRTLLSGADGSMIAIDTMARGSQIRLSDSSFIKKIDKHSWQLSGLVIGRMSKPLNIKVGIDLKFVNLLYPDDSRVTLELHAMYSWSSYRNPAHPDSVEGGKARFDITKNSQSPWSIHLPDSTFVGDLATCFEIDASIAQTPKVSLVSGALMIKANRRTVELHPKEQAIIKNGEPIVSPLAVDTALWIWAKEPLVFNFKNTSLDQTVHTIANYYRVVVSNPQNVQGIHVTANIPASKGLDFLCKRITEIQSTTAYLRMSADSIYITDRKP